MVNNPTNLTFQPGAFGSLQSKSCHGCRTFPTWAEASKRRYERFVVGAGIIKLPICGASSNTNVW